MPKPSPQFLVSATASALAMVVFALSAPAISSRSEMGIAGSPAVAGIEMPSLPALPTLLPR